MEWLICEIQTISRNIHSYKQSQQKFQVSNLRIERSLTSPPMKTTKLTDNSGDHKTRRHGLSQASHKYSRSTITLSSESDFTSNRQFARERSSSFSSRTKLKNRRCSSVEESDNHTTIIHEFPESPTFNSRSVPDYVHCSNVSSKFYPTSQGTKVTNNPKERYYSGSPLSNRRSSMITSMPSMSQSFSEDGEESYHNHPIIITSTWISGEQDDNISTSQPHGIYTEKSSQQSSTSIRSPSTCQPEYYQTHYQGQQMKMTPHGIQTESLSQQSQTSIRRTSSTHRQERYQTRYQGQQMGMTPHGINTESSSQKRTSIRRSLSTCQPEHYQTYYQGQRMEMTPPHGLKESLSQKSNSLTRNSQPEYYRTRYNVLQEDTTEVQSNAECNKNDTSLRVLNQGKKSTKRKLSQLDPAILVETSV